MTHLYLIRHAQANGLKTDVAGSMVPNSGLSPLGLKQAERLRDRLASTGEIKAGCKPKTPPSLTGTRPISPVMDAMTRSGV